MATNIQVGDLVTYRRPATKKMFFMGLADCRVLKVHPDEKFQPDGEQAVQLEWNGDKFYSRLSWLEKQPKPRS